MFTNLLVNVFLEKGMKEKKYSTVFHKQRNVKTLIFNSVIGTLSFLSHSEMRYNACIKTIDVIIAEWSANPPLSL